MGLQDVKEELLNEAHHEKNVILEKAKIESTQIMEHAKKKAAEEKENSLKATKKNLEENEKREGAAALLDAKKKLLAEEKELMHGAIEKVRDHLSSLKKKEREEILSTLLAKAAAEIAIGKIICDNADAPVFSSYIVEMKPITGGFIAENKDGTISVDLTFDTMLEEVKEKYSQEVMRALLK